MRKDNQKYSMKSEMLLHFFVFLLWKTFYVKVVWVYLE
jgi:hypothetical protein